MPSASSQRRLQADDEKKHIQEVFYDTVRSNNKLGHNNCEVCQRSNEDAKFIRIKEIKGMLKRVVDYLQNVQKNKP